MLNSRKWLDLSHPLSEDIKVYPGDPPFRSEHVASYSNEGYLLKQLSSGMHSGTHIDFPAHFLEGGKTCADYSVERFIGRAVLIDADISNGIISTKSFIRDYQALAFKVEIVILACGHSHLWGSVDYFVEYPKFENDFGSSLRKTNIGLLFTDLPTVVYRDGDFSAMHKELLGHDILIGENLKIPATMGRTLEFSALPLPLKDFEASLVRAIAKNV